MTFRAGHRAIFGSKTEPKRPEIVIATKPLEHELAELAAWARPSGGTAQRLRRLGRCCTAVRGEAAEEVAHWERRRRRKRQR